MRVLMLGWEFPPFITGGLGTACAGLTRALVQQGVHVDFVLPRPVSSSEVDGVQVLSPGSPSLAVKSQPRKSASAIGPASGQPKTSADNSSLASPTDQCGPVQSEIFNNIPGLPPFTPEQQRRLDVIAVESFLQHPYPIDNTSGPVSTFLEASSGNPIRAAAALNQFVQQGGDVPDDQQVLMNQLARQAWREASVPGRLDNEPTLSAEVDGAQGGISVPTGDYGEDLKTQVRNFSQFCVSSLAAREFDVIHAHDWMTYEAGLALRAVTGKPLVVHVHSTEFDRSGEHGNPDVTAIESRGIREADRVICVSALTRNLVVSRYEANPERCRVIYNGVELAQDNPVPSEIRRDDRIVLYFGRITYQKGPEFFMAAAKRVLEHMSNVKFVVAGSGDQAERMIRMAAELGIGDRVLFTGFLRGRDISRVFSLADLYVMPSRSEPFGIAPLEAMSHGVPVLISKTSGVSEVLTHALKVDFWDIEDMASKIIAVLKYPPLSQHLKDHGQFEVRRITWDGAAEKCRQIYDRAME